MKIKSLKVDGFRCLQGLNISFEDDLTVIVGENDSGKTSLIDCFKVITQNQPIEIDDFYNGSDKIELSLENEDSIFHKVYQKDGDNTNDLPLEVHPKENYLNKIKTELESGGFDTTQLSNEEKVKEIARLFGLVVRSDSNIDKLRTRILEIIIENQGNPDFKIDSKRFPQFNNIQLDGKQFENVSSFFKEVFLKEKQSSIWQEKISSGATIEEFINEKIESYSEEISAKMNETGIKEKIKIFLKNLTDIRIEPIYQTRDLNIDAKVKFLENGKEINLQKKGDGTKRRITMALLEFKNDQVKTGEDRSTVYLLDEPDTHLHVKAQIELLQTLQGFAQAGNQVILTTHSPFLINSVRPNQIRLLSLDKQNCARIKYLGDQQSIPDNILQSLGIENVYLFFARTILVVEGETEETFITNYFLRRMNTTISANLIKIINVRGIHNIYGFARAILELHDPDRIYAVFDNDLSEELKELIDQLNIHPDRKYIIGEKEFEDAFSDETLFNCWEKYCGDNGRNCPEDWTVEKIKCVREKCISGRGLKFSKEIRKLNAKGKIMMTKPNLGFALAQYIDDKDLPSPVTDLFQVLSS